MAEKGGESNQGFQDPPPEYKPSPGFQQPVTGQPGGQWPQGFQNQVPMQSMGQPQQDGDKWMTRPNVQNCPPGLEYLSVIDQLIVKQQVELFEAITGWETQNKYKIHNSVGQQVYFALEETSCLMRQCCGPARGFVINIVDNNNQPVMSITRHFKCCAGCCWCANNAYCAFNVEVTDRDGNLLGTVRQECSGWKPRYSVSTAEGDTVGEINGPCCVCNLSCCGDVQFPVTAPEGQHIGTVAKQWSGWGKELFTDAETFSVQFPRDMDIRTKATFIGALFLIDFMYFENKN